MQNKQIRQRVLGSSKLSVSEVGLGCWQLGGDFGPLSEDKAMAIIQQAVDSGITFFDTADVYGGGISEQYLGEHLNKLLPQAVIATKYGRGEGTYPDGYSLNDLRDSVLRAQDRLQRDVIDLIQLHCIPKPILQEGKIFDCLREVQQQGLIRHFGASVETEAEAEICLQHSDLSSIQIIFNLMRQRPIVSLLNKAKQSDVGVIVRLPLASGMLSGKFTAQTQFDESDHRNFNKDGDAFSVGETFSGIEYEKGLQIVETMQDFVPKQYTMAKFAMRWILDHEAVSSIIPGASSPQQVIQNTAVSSLESLDEALHKELFSYYQKHIEQHIRCEI